MNEKLARANIRLALSILRKRIRFPMIRRRGAMIREMLASEGLIDISKEILGQFIQKRLSRRGGG
jgi:hypothetical protein